MSPLGGRARRLVAWGLAAQLVAACAGAAGLASTSRDPWSYCSAVGSIDAPDARYTGAPFPPPLAEGLRRAMGAPADAPLDAIARGAYWRCMGGEVYACAVGANLPCQAKADLSRAPSAPVAEFCRQNPSADVIPAYVTGRATVYEWRCAQGAPATVRQVDAADAQGFLSNIWYAIPPGP